MSDFTSVSAYLDLVDRGRPDLPDLLNLFNMSDPVIAHTNVPHYALLLCFLECLPHERPTLFPSVRAVNQK